MNELQQETKYRHAEARRETIAALLSFLGLIAGVGLGVIASHEIPALRGEAWSHLLGFAGGAAGIYGVAYISVRIRRRY